MIGGFPAQRASNAKNDFIVMFHNLAVEQYDDYTETLKYVMEFKIIL